MRIRMGRLLPLALCLLLLLCAACGSRTQEPASRQAVIDGQSAEIAFDPLNAAAGTVTAESGVYTFAWERTGDLSITYPDGSVYTWGGTYGSGTVGEEYIDGVALAWALESAYRQDRPGGGNGASPLLAALLLAMGAWFLLSPRSAWWLGRGWRYKNAEPSDLALGLYRAGGVLLLLTGAICLLASFGS